MDHRRALVALLLPLGACLSNPTPHPQNEDTFNAATTGDDASTKTDTTEGVDGPSDTGLPNPPEDAVDADGEVMAPDTGIELRELLVTNIDGDAYDDLLLANWIDDPAEWGVNVYLGANGRLGFLFRDFFVNTRPRPEAIARMRLDTTAAADQWDLVVLGTVDGPSQTVRGYVQVFPITVGPSVDGFEAADPYQRETTDWFEPNGQGRDNPKPLHLLSVDSDGNSVPELLIGDFDNLHVLEPAIWNAGGLSEAPHARVDANDAMSMLRLIVPVTFEAQSYVAVWQESFRVTWFPFTGSYDPGSASTLYTAASHVDAARGDFDGDGKPEIVGFREGLVSFIKLEPPNVKEFARFPEYTLYDDDLDDIAVGDADRSGKNDIVILDSFVDRRATVRLIRDPVLQPPRGGETVGTLSSNASTDAPGELPEGFVPRRLAVGRFNDRGVEVWAFDAYGRAACLGWDVDEDALVSCSP